MNPDDADDLAAGVADAYADAELGVLARIARFIGTGLGLSTWATDRRDGAGVVRRTLGGLLSKLFGRGRRAAERAAVEAERRVVAAADAELGARSEDLPLPSGVHAKRGVEDILSDLRPVESAVVDQAMSAYHRIISQVSTEVDAGTRTRLQAAARALELFADEGIKGFIDRSGRRWELRTYVEMAVRTRVMNVMVDAHVDRVQSLGVNLVMISEAPYECDLCKRWEGKVLEVGGPSGPHEVKARGAGGGSVTVQVAGSLEEARAAGLFHPNCRHNVSAYQPGMTRTPTKTPTTATYKDTQHLRYLERQARRWDRRRAVALTDEGRKAANAQWRAYRKRAAEFSKQKGLPRKTNRERHDAVR
jgi:hypothetical protein